MKKLLMLIAIILFGNSVIAQNKLYLLFEFMKVEAAQEGAYLETETFWQKIQEQRTKNGDIIGWDLWSLQPGGKDQGYQYLTVTLYNDPVKMMSGAGNFEAAIKAAYPKMSEEEFNEKFISTAKSRDLAVRIYLEQIASTKDDFKMPIGTIAGINLMKVSDANFENYEKFENEIFKPYAQKEIEAGNRGNWGLMRCMLPMGSDVYATHITSDMYEDYKQLFNNNMTDYSTISEAETKKFQDGLATRDMKYKYMGTLIKKVR
ncbi:hypothetical protein [Flavobacterium cellulosilyticum]|uniref:Uncharacterized protein n=1 Tax=Flavobacterium cellulosilyticum TaxID=2541731 RepID=A0A4R5CI95_9FLAO|nr:hypothetical protein [Flavobacterium cellulosilyticum]TDD98023.1 hypothetical protein E0F76_07970 [Flavobacterium cellulosilyticum]